MNREQINAFHKAFDFNYNTNTSNETNHIRIKESNYELRLKFSSRSGGTIVFRPENLKATAGYLQGGMRGAGKDNDLTIFDDNIFELEVKRSVEEGKHQVARQFIGGMFWTNHLLSLIKTKLEDWNPKIYCVFIFVPIKRRPGGRFTNHIQIDTKDYEDYVTVKLEDDRIREINIDDVLEFAKRNSNGTSPVYN